MSDETADPVVPAAALRAAAAFVTKHGPKVRAVLENLGSAGVRVVLIGSDHAVGDVLVPDEETGEALGATVSGVELGDWDAPTVAAVDFGQRHRRRMAGPRARG